MGIPSYANPSLSELLQPGRDRAQQVENDTNRTTANIGQVPAIVDRMQQHQAQQEESARQNSPISPWQVAAARLAMGHDPKEVADHLKSNIGGAPGVGVPQQGSGYGAPQGVPQQQTQLPQVVGNTSQMPGGIPMPSGLAPGMDRTVQGGMPNPSGPPQSNMSPTGYNMPRQMNSVNSSAPQDFTNGMTHRDFTELMQYAPTLHKAQAPTRDYMGELALKLAGGQKETETKVEGAKQVATIGADAKKETTATRDATTKERDSATKDYHDRLVELGWAKLKELEKKHNSDEKYRSDPVLRDLTARYAATMGFMGHAVQSPYALSGNGKQEVSKANETRDQLEAAIEKREGELNAAKVETGTDTKTSSSSKSTPGTIKPPTKTPATTPANASPATPTHKYSVGEVVPYKDAKTGLTKNRKITAVDGQGNITQFTTVN